MDKSAQATHWIRDYFAIPAAPLVAGIVARHIYCTHELNTPKVIPDLMFMVAVMTVVTAGDLGRIDQSKNKNRVLLRAGALQALLFFFGMLNAFIYGGYIFATANPSGAEAPVAKLVGIVWILSLFSTALAFAGAVIVAESD
jgi:hypothetical protein